MVDTLEGADAPALTAKVGKMTANRLGAAATAALPAAASTAAAAGETVDVMGRVKFLLSSHPVVLFMKVCNYLRACVLACIARGAWCVVCVCVCV